MSGCRSFVYVDVYMWVWADLLVDVIGDFGPHWALVALVFIML